MSERDKKKGFIPWHEKVDEDLIRELASQFVQSVYLHGLRITDLKVSWHDPSGEFETSTIGERVESQEDEPGG